MELMYTLLDTRDISGFKALMDLFGEEFDDKNSYQGAIPGEEYIKDFLSNKKHLVLVAQDRGVVVGGLVAYELNKFEQEISEIFIYDLAISKKYQRKGIATALVEALKKIAKERGISTIFVQADKVDKEAVSFYKSLHAKQSDTYYFDIKS